MITVFYLFILSGGGNSPRPETLAFRDKDQCEQAAQKIRADIPGHVQLYLSCVQGVAK